MSDAAATSPLYTTYGESSDERAPYVLEPADADGAATHRTEGVSSPMSAETTAPLDDLVLARARRGDRGALETVYRHLEAPMFTVARRLCRQREDAEEVLQEAFLEVVRSISRFRAEGSFEGWVRRITASKALMRLRKRGRSREMPFDADDAAEAADEPSRPAAHETLQRRLDLETALGRLPDATRLVVWLHDVEGYTHDEIARAVGKTASYSKSQLSRAHARLRDWLEPAGEEGPCT
jgi:RNA polymerase sigma factor (sigma-70 family)